MLIFARAILFINDVRNRCAKACTSLKQTALRPRGSTSDRFRSRDARSNREQRRARCQGAEVLTAVASRKKTEPLDHSTIESTAAKIASPAPAAVVARKQRRPSVESGDLAATDAVALVNALCQRSHHRLRPIPTNDFGMRYDHR